MADVRIDPKPLRADWEEIIPLPTPAARVTPARRLRSTILVSSISGLEVIGRSDDYYDALPARFHDTMRSLAVGEWVEMDLAVTHYEAVESLGIDAEQAYRNGRRVADRIQNAYIKTVLRSMASGVSPWVAVARMTGAVDRLMDGGAFAVYKLGPKDGRVEFHGLPIARFPYLRHGLRGLFASSAELLLRKIHIRDLTPPASSSVIVYEASWV